MHLVRKLNPFHKGRVDHSVSDQRGDDTGSGIHRRSLSQTSSSLPVTPGGGGERSHVAVTQVRANGGGGTDAVSESGSGGCSGGVKCKATEKELQLLNVKIEKLLANIEDSTNDDSIAFLKDEEQCVICMAARSTMQTSPCGHRVVCRKCFIKTIQAAVTQRRLPLRCVVCRAKILKLKQSPSPPSSASFSTMMSSAMTSSRSRSAGSGVVRRGCGDGDKSRSGRSVRGVEAAVELIEPRTKTSHNSGGTAEHSNCVGNGPTATSCTTSSYSPASKVVSPRTNRSVSRPSAQPPCLRATRDIVFRDVISSTALMSRGRLDSRQGQQQLAPPAVVVSFHSQSATTNDSRVPTTDPHDRKKRGVITDSSHDVTNNYLSVSMASSQQLVALAANSSRASAGQSASRSADNHVTFDALIASNAEDRLKCVNLNSAVDRSFDSEFSEGYHHHHRHHRHHHSTTSKHKSLRSDSGTVTEQSDNKSSNILSKKGPVGAAYLTNHPSTNACSPARTASAAAVKSSRRPSCSSVVPTSSVTGSRSSPATKFMQPLLIYPSPQPAPSVDLKRGGGGGVGGGGEGGGGSGQVGTRLKTSQQAWMSDVSRVAVDGAH